MRALPGKAMLSYPGLFMVVGSTSRASGLWKKQKPEICAPKIAVCAFTRQKVYAPKSLRTQKVYAPKSLRAKKFTHSKSLRAKKFARQKSILTFSMVPLFFVLA